MGGLFFLLIPAPFAFEGLFKKSFAHVCVYVKFVKV